MWFYSNLRWKVDMPSCGVGLIVTMVRYLSLPLTVPQVVVAL